MPPLRRPVALVGLSGTGKSSVAPLLADLLGAAPVDLDDLIEQREGAPVADLFAERGEEGFRWAEAAALATVLAGDPTVIATGGGVVTTPEGRRLLAGATVVWLHAPVEVLLERLAGPGAARPLLAGDPRTALGAMATARDPLYAAACDLEVAVGDAEPAEVARRIAGALENLGEGAGPAGDRPEVLTVRVELPDDRGYDVVVGHDVRHALADAIPDTARRVAVVTQEAVGVEVDPGVEHRVFVIGPDEHDKDLATIERLCRQWSAWGLSRADCVVGVGGGLVTDVAGFAASVYHRGLPVVHVATTLLAQVDAAIGGKTGVNLPEGKNLVGAYWQPRAVFCDTATLATLPPREWRCGLGEMAKYHWLGGGRLDELPLAQRVAACVRIKAAVVASDERESGRRALLNYGHTLAHAVETAGGHELRHGEAVAVGLVYAAELARALGRIDDAAVAEHRRVVTGYDLPTSLPPGLEDDEELLGLMARDKKSLDGGLTFVLDGPDGLEVVEGVDAEVVAATLDAVR